MGLLLLGGPLWLWRAGDRGGLLLGGGSRRSRGLRGRLACCRLLLGGLLGWLRGSLLVAVCLRLLRSLAGLRGLMALLGLERTCRIPLVGTRLATLGRLLWNACLRGPALIRVAHGYTLPPWATHDARPLWV